MAITMTCPRCTHKNTFDDGKAKQQVHCRICHHQFALPADSSKPAASAVSAASVAPVPTPASPTPPPAGRETVKAGPPRPDAKRADPDERRAKETRRRDRREDDDDDDRDRPSRRRRKQGSSGPLFWVFGGLGVVLLLSCCGVGALGVLGVGLWQEKQVVIGDGPVVIGDAPAVEFNAPPVVVNQPPPPPPAPPPPPPPPKLDPRNPRDGTEALARLKNNGPEVDEAFRWLRDADVNHPLGRDFARELDRLVENQKRQPFPNGAFFDAYFRWANSTDNFDSLMRMLQEEGLGNNRRQRAMETLGRLKEARAAEAITLRLADFFDRGAATKALQAMGDAAQPALLKHLNDANGDVRSNAQRLLENLRVSTDVLITQTIADLKSTDDKVRNAATEWLTRTPVDEKRRPAVARALNEWITPQSLEGPLYKALELWGTADNGMTVAKTIDSGNVFQAANRIKLLGKLKDPLTLPTLTARIGKFGFEGNAAQDAVRQFGTVAEKEVIKQLVSPDQGTRHAACQLLGDVGTQKVSFPAMQRAVNIYPQDRQLDNHAKNSAKRILARGA